jgi:hypothetical protein
MGRKSVMLSVGTPLGPYPTAYRRAYGLSFRWTVLKTFEVRCVELGNEATRRVAVRADFERPV